MWQVGPKRYETSVTVMFKMKRTMARVQAKTCEPMSNILPGVKLQQTCKCIEMARTRAIDAISMPSELQMEGNYPRW